MAIGLAVLIVVIVCWLLLSGGDDSTETKGSASTSETKSSSLGSGPALVDAGDLRALAASLGHPVYWLGERSDTQLELTHEDSGNVYVRYLTEDAEVGDPKQAYVTVGTYPVTDAVGAVRRAAAEEGVEVEEVPEGGIAFASAANPGNAYVAYPGGDYQVEVFAPKAGEAFELISAGEVVPVE